MTLDSIGGELGLTSKDMARPAKRRAVVTRLGNRVMDEINRVTAVTPGALAAMALLGSQAPQLAERDIVLACRRLLAVLTRWGARVSSTLSTESDDILARSVREALQMFVDAQLLSTSVSSEGPPTQTIYTINEEKRLQLDTSKNIILHFFVERGLIASALDRNDEGNIIATPIDRVRTRVQWASRIFKHEFRFRADSPFEEIFEETLRDLIDEGQIKRSETTLDCGAGFEGWCGAEWLRVYRAILVAIFEGYLIAIKSLDRLFAGPRSEKDLVKGALALGQALLQKEAIGCREAISKPVLVNAYHSLSELGYLRTRSGKLELDERYKSRGALDELQRTLKGFLTGQHEITE
jgi:glycerol-3-phosphate O-acyltransferase